MRVFKLVLVEQITEYEGQGWRLVNDRVHVALGGWPSVYMERLHPFKESIATEVSTKRGKGVDSAWGV